MSPEQLTVFRWVISENMDENYVPFPHIHNISYSFSVWKPFLFEEPFSLSLKILLSLWHSEKLKNLRVGFKNENDMVIYTFYP